MVRKIKVLISLFVILLVLSMDLGTFFSNVENGVVVAKGHEMFEFANLQHNLQCITGAIKAVVSTKNKTDKEQNTNLVDKYGNALADATTKAVEKAITSKDKQEKSKESFQKD
ncbi:MAG: hypothetical protein HFJ09_13590 [Lachnospiraceae bacterium]|nr:hypothetical protein [Lachnospiraceae bacterium]